MRDYPLKEGFQQRKLPRDAGEWPALAIRKFRWQVIPGSGEENKLSNRSMKTAECKVTIAVSDWELTGEPASKASFTFVNLKTLWHLSQWPLQQDFGVEYTE